MIRDRVLNLWRVKVEGRNRKGREVVSGVASCPKCGHDARVLVFEAQTKRTDRSPDYIGYANPERECSTSSQAGA